MRSNHVEIELEIHEKHDGNPSATGLARLRSGVLRPRRVHQLLEPVALQAATTLWISPRDHLAILPQGRKRTAAGFLRH